MITFHPSISEVIPSEYILLMADRVGYNGYIPTQFIRHLIAAFSFYKFCDDPTLCITEKNDYTTMFEKLLKLIQFDSVRTNNPVEFAFRVLLSQKRKINFRSLEKHINNKSGFEVSEEEVFNNYAVDLKSLTRHQLLALDIDSNENFETITLSDDIQRILKFYEGVLFLEPTFETTYFPIKKQIESYTDFYKIRKYKFGLPSFKVDLGTKKLQITKVDDREELGSKAIIAIDFSLSMLEHADSVKLIRSALLYYIGKFEKQPKLTIDIVIIADRILSVLVINSTDELVSFFKTLNPFMLPIRCNKSFLTELNNLYSGKSIVFLSDGNYEIPSIKPITYTLNTVCLTDNIGLQELSLSSGGRFILLR